MICAIVDAITDHAGLDARVRMRDALEVGRLAGVGDDRGTGGRWCQWFGRRHFVQFKIYFARSVILAYAGVF